MLATCSAAWGKHHLRISHKLCISPHCITLLCDYHTFLPCSPLVACCSPSGQVCCAIKRIYVHADVAPEFISHLKSRIESHLVMGDPLAATTTLGPLTLGHRAVERLTRWVVVSNTPLRYQLFVHGGAMHCSRAFCVSVFIDWVVGASVAWVILLVSSISVQVAAESTLLPL